jgi:3-deoxy-D-manno-octulosonic acid kinase
MTAIHEQVLLLEHAGIVYDATRVRKPQMEMFDRDDWRSKGGLQEVSGGRGSVAFISVDGQQWVLRHYRRGGFVARISDDRYWWLGANRTRSFVEWRLLAELKSRDLPVPGPVAAAYVRKGFTYRADLITEALPNTKTLAQLLMAGALDESAWRAIGETIARFHAQGVHHADLNANNILLQQGTGAVYVLDFDRGRIRERGAWEQAVLDRLHRSLVKLRERNSVFHFGEREWAWLVEGQRKRMAAENAKKKLRL